MLKLELHLYYSKQALHTAELGHTAAAGTAYVNILKQQQLSRMQTIYSCECIHILTCLAYQLDGGHKTGA
jgi:hypothetical protein